MDLAALDWFMVIIFWLFFAIFLATLAPAITVGDAGEFVAVANILGIAHPPGYPLFSLLGKVAIILIPFGNLAYRLNVLSAALGVLAAVVMLWQSRKYFSDDLAALISSLGIFSYIGWRVCIQTEVFSLLLLLAVTLFWLNTIDDWRIAYLEMFLFGLAMTNHQLIAFVYLPLLIYRLYQARLAKRLKEYIFSGLFFFVLGFSLYLFLLIRSQKSPVLNWTGAENFYKLWRIITRADYGSLALTVGEKLPYNFYHLVTQFWRFLLAFKKQVTLFGAVVGLVGLFFPGRTLSKKIGLIILLTGPLFFWLANLPFNPEADGVLERFLVIPAFFLFLGVGALVKKLTSFWLKGLSLLLFGLLLGWRLPELNWRNNFLAADYGRNVLKTVEPGGVMFIDGGDDTFYSVAWWQLAENYRRDVEVHDRGGLVFPNIYGADFRWLSRSEKEVRRLAKEQAMARSRPIYYFTFRADIWPQTTLANSGFAYYFSRTIRPDAYPLYYRRNIYDFDFADYRSQALVPIYDYFEPAVISDLKNISVTLRKHQMVEWYRKNLYLLLSQRAYNFYQMKNYSAARNIYDFLIEHWAAEPVQVDALLNAGVCAEKMNEREAARRYYQKAVAISPDNPRIYYNLAVLDWGRDWSAVVENLRRARTLSPDDRQIANYLQLAEEKLRK